MMELYFVKKDLWGIQAGRVERFHPNRALPLVRDGLLIPYDPKKHSSAPGSPESDAAAREERDRKQKERLEGLKGQIRTK